MRPELETYQLIDNYLNGSLTGDAFVAFEKRMQSDAGFAEEVDLVKLSNQVVIGASIESLRQQMRADITEKEKKSMFSKVKNWSAGILLGTAVLTTGLFYVQSSKEELSKKNILNKEDATTTNTKNPLTQNSSISIQNSLPVSTSKPTKTKQTAPISTPIPSTNPVTEERTSPVVSTTPINTQAIPVIETKPAPAFVNQETINTNPCLNIHIQADITSKPSCRDQHTGSISILQNSIKGGIKPYSIQFNGSKATTKKEFYSYLSAGTYSIEIADSNGCSQHFTKDVTESNCRKTTYVFAPDKGETWKITGLDDAPFRITIINISGKTVYTSEYIDGTFEWNGFNQQGNYLDSGLYIYILESNSGEKENGQVTIAR